MPTAGMYGRRAPKRAASLKLADYLTGVVPTHPNAVDYLAAMSGGWQMLGNDQYGDCVAVTWANTRRLVTTVLGTANYPTWPQVEAFYKTQNPGFPQQDDGMEIQTALEDLVKVGGPDGVKAAGFAAVDYTNPDEVKAAIAIFGSVWVGINVQDAQQTQFSEGKPWDWVNGSGIDGGHSIVSGGYGPAGVGSLGGDERFITWAAETSFTDRYWSKGVEECWVVIWPEHLGTLEFQQGLDVAALAADYQAITGKPFPAVVPPAPTPTPTPTPTPGPDSASDTFAKVLMAENPAGQMWVDQRHDSYIHTVAKAGRAWLEAEGYIPTP